jgi:hypothetical protein
MMNSLNERALQCPTALQTGSKAVASNSAAPIPANTSAIERMVRAVVIGVFVAALLHSLFALSRGWNYPLLDYFGFRQTQTAISAYFIALGGPLFAYETPVLGGSWSIPFEFPLYQWIAAALYRVTGMNLDAAGRAVSVFFFYLCVWPLWSFLGALGLKSLYRLVLITLIATSPYYLFWSRTFTIESTALFLSLAYLAAVVRYAEKPGVLSFFIAASCGLAAALVKLTTFVPFPLLGGVIYAQYILKRYPRGQLSFAVKRLWVQLLLSPFLAFAMLPLVGVQLWTSFADAQKAKVPLAGFINSGALHQFLCGTLDQRLSADLWIGVVYGRAAGGILGWSWMFVLPLVLAIFSRKFSGYYLASMLLFLGTFLVFTNLHMMHEYYQYANGIFLLSASGFGIISLLDRRGLLQIAGLAVFVVTTALQAFCYYAHGQYQLASVPSDTLLAITRAIDEKSRPQDIILIYGYDWDSSIPYYAHRRAIMDREMRSLNDPLMRESFAKSRRRDGIVAVAAFCNKSREATDVTDRLSTLGFDLIPYYADNVCDLYKRRGRTRGPPPQHRGT